MKSIKLLFSLLFVAYILSSCSNADSEAVTPDNYTAISDSIMRTLQTSPAIAEDEAEVIKLNGKIQPNDALQAKVYALVSGKIKSVNAELGDYVKKGQQLAVIQSTEVAGTSNDLSLAQSDVALTKKSLETTKDLYEGKLATEQDFINAKVAYNKAESELNHAREVSAITGGKSSAYILTAPLSGYIIEKNITNNSEVRNDNNTDLFAIADLSNVWVIANVYEADMNNIALGEEVKVNTLADPEKDYSGKIDKIYNVLDPNTRTMKVRISMNNPNGELKPEMFATVTVSGKPSANKVLTIPSQAIVLDNSNNYVVVKEGNKLKIKQIEIIKRVDPKAFVTGISAGEQVVTNSQVFLYQALNTK